MIFFKHKALKSLVQATKVLGASVVVFHVAFVMTCVVQSCIFAFDCTALKRRMIS
jgi:hypothetical protein